MALSFLLSLFVHFLPTPDFNTVQHSTHHAVHGCHKPGVFLHPVCYK